ncbi:hypothetical protein Poly30_25240 [Planctomycetes bacterium Poly30]|uniref:Uncharacterized protein n=1 Tax=Saltatorellus ferox TaxID=2528018 RepID=A0A518ESH4_9BACT|nr:hypothetical protein Poly30_25240 [Planctomycetes bacterium Poly30]
MSDDESPAAHSHPASLKPLSAGCLVPVFLALAVMAVAYVGLRKIVDNTGPWALQAADKALLDSGIPEVQRTAFGAEIERLRVALDSEEADPGDVFNGVAGLLESPILPLLVVDDVLDRRLPASGLTAEEKAEVRSTLIRFRAGADAQVLKYQDLVALLGPLARTEEEGGPQAELSDAELLEMGERARAATADLDIPKLDTEPTYEVLLQRYRDHVDAVLAGKAPRIERSR